MSVLERSIPDRLGLRRGDRVRVRRLDEILATLDERGCLDALPFMPEMRAFCAQTFVVSASAHKTCDTITNTGGRRMDRAVHLADLRCDGAAHGGCQAACLLFWKEAWLEQVDAEDRPLETQRRSRPLPAPVCDEPKLEDATRRSPSEDDTDLRYVCQTTELVRATQPLPWWDLRQYVRDVRSRNVSLGELANALYFRFTVRAMGLVGYRFWRGLYDRIQRRIGGVPFPEIEGRLDRTPRETLDLEPGEEVEVKPLDEIVATLDRRNRNRGMAFDKEMAPFCGERHRVFQRVERIIDEASGRMLELPNGCLMLEGVVCRSRYSERRIACPRAIYSYWRECWLRRVDTPPS
jgi:hypothetical protein